MSAEVCDQLHNDPSLHLQEHLDKVVPCCFKDWSRVVDPSSLADGLVQGLGALVHELSEGVTDALYDPIKGAYSHGLVGGAAGFSSGLQSLLKKPLSGGRVFVHKVRKGVAASLRDSAMRDQDQEVDFNPDACGFDDEPFDGPDSLEALDYTTSFSSPIVRTPIVPIIPKGRGLPQYLESSAITQLAEEPSSYEDDEVLDTASVGEEQDGCELGDDDNPFAFFFDDERDIESVYHSIVTPSLKEEEGTAPLLHTDELHYESDSAGETRPTSRNEAYRAALQARELFTALGAVEGR